MPEDMESFRAKQELVWQFIRHAIAHVREKDPVNALGVGNTYAYEIEPSKTAPLVDILVYHDYFETRSRVRNVCEIMKRLSEQYHKPVINNETCCLCRSNPYDMALEILQEYHFGFYVFELMIGNDMWRRVHGICYPDGTVRDPSIVAAVQGFFPQPHLLRAPGECERGRLRRPRHPSGHEGAFRHGGPLEPRQQKEG